MSTTVLYAKVPSEQYVVSNNLETTHNTLALPKNMLAIL